MDGTGPGGRGPTPVRPAALHLARREPEPKRVVTTLVRVLLLNASHEPLAVVTRAGVLRRDSRRCVYCQGRGETVDHVVPKSRGGTDSWENCVACCVRCNTRKADRLLEELGWSMPLVPGPPRRGAFGRLWSTEDADPAWEPWLAFAA